MRIKRFNEDKDNSSMSSDDLLIDLIDYGFKMEKSITNYKLSYEGNYDLAEVAELYYDAIVKIKAFKDIEFTSFITKKKTVLITYDIIDKVDDDDHITISLNKEELELKPYSFATYINDENEIYYLLVYCKNAKNRVSQISFYSEGWREHKGIINGNNIEHKFGSSRKFKIDNNNSDKILKLINNNSLNSHGDWDSDTKAAFAKLKPEHLSNK